MANESSQQDGRVQGTVFWDRINSLFSRRTPGHASDDEPRRRGMAVTMAIVVSSLLWFTFTMRETHTKIVQMPTQVVNLPQDQALSQLPPENVRVQIVGDGWSLLRLRVSPPTVEVNASQQEVAVREAIPELPKNVDIQSVSPATLNLWKERRITRKIPVALRATIDTPQAYDLLNPPTLIPDSVEITGAASLIRQFDEWPTARRAFKNVRDTLNTQLALSDTLEGLIAKNIQVVTLRAVSEQFTEGTREIDVTVQGQPSTQKLVSLEPSSVQVKYTVLFSQYQDAQDAMDFFATVSYDEIRLDTTGRVRPHLHLPKNLELRDVEMVPQTLGYYERID